MGYFITIVVVTCVALLYRHARNHNDHPRWLSIEVSWYDIFGMKRHDNKLKVFCSPSDTDAMRNALSIYYSKRVGYTVTCNNVSIGYGVSSPEVFWFRQVEAIQAVGVSGE